MRRAEGSGDWVPDIPGALGDMSPRCPRPPKRRKSHREIEIDTEPRNREKKGLWWSSILRFSIKFLSNPPAFNMQTTQISPSAPVPRNAASAASTRRSGRSKPRASARARQTSASRAAGPQSSAPAPSAKCGSARSRRRLHACRSMRGVPIGFKEKPKGIFLDFVFLFLRGGGGGEVGMV